jgi:hypothetical protein
MAYQRTVAFPSRSTAFHGGDPVYIRHANGPFASSITLDNPSLGALGYGEEAATAASTASTVSTITNAINALTALTGTFMAVRQAKIDSKDQKAASAAAQQQAAAAQQQAAEAQQAVNAAVQAAQKPADNSGTKKELMIGAAVLGAVLLGGFFLLRRK